MPTPSDFIEYMNGGSMKDKAEIEVSKVLDAIGRHGAYTSVAFDNAITQAVIVTAYGGWVKLCQSCGVDESEPWFRKKFTKTWAAFAQQGMKHTGHLPGIIEISNRNNGYDEQVTPRLIGDTAKAQAILDAGKASLPMDFEQRLRNLIRDCLHATSNPTREHVICHTFLHSSLE